MRDTPSLAPGRTASGPAPAPANAQLLRLVVDAGRHVPMYRRLWAESGIDVSDLRTMRDFQRLPRVDKAALRASRPEDRIHARRLGSRLVEERSSGSSGEPLTVFKDRYVDVVRRWAFLRALHACGYRPGQPCLLLTSRRDAREWRALRWCYASIGEDTATLAGRLEALGAGLLYGPLGTLECLAGHLAAQPSSRSAARLVVSTAEQLTRPRRATLERGFGSRIADFYGMTEFGLIAYRPPGGSAFLPARPSLLLEFLPVPGEPALERLVVTDLAARCSPLIRYDTGDLVRRDTGRATRPILEFAGRSFDSIVRPDGEHISPYRLDVLLEQVVGLNAYEVVQQADRSIDVTLEVEPGTAERVEAIVRRELQSVVGADLALRVGLGPIRRDPSGAKFRAIRSHASGGA
jgi:phenylacetate-CoA ligase